jgi:hypothetical protein
MVKGTPPLPPLPVGVKGLALNISFSISYISFGVVPFQPHHSVVGYSYYEYTSHTSYS